MRQHTEYIPVSLLSVLNLLYPLCLACGVKDKLRIIAIAIPQFVTKTVGKEVSIARIAKMLWRNTVVKIGGVKYALLDYESFLIVSPKYYETKFVPKWLRPKRGEVVIDIGAHIGRYTMSIAKAVGDEGMVVAIEPHPENYKALQRNIELNRLKNAIALNLAAWEKDCELRLFIGDCTGHHSARINRGLGLFKSKARAMDNVLKELSLDRIDWIKIDVEGAECEVLYGLGETLSKQNPKIVIEISCENTHETKRFMKDHEYELIRISPTFKENAYFFGLRCPKNLVIREWKH